MALDTLTWSFLLARWTHIAQGVKALPPGVDGDRWRRALPSLVALDAITHALAELHDLPESEHALGQDRAEVLVRGHAAELHALWRGEALPDSVRAWIDDARLALLATREGGVEFDAPEGFAGLDRGRWDAVVDACGSLACDLWMLAPGEVVEAGVPLAFVRGRRGRRPGDDDLRRLGSLLGAGPGRRVPQMRQVYRWGAGQSDRVVAMDETLPAGRPLLAPAVEQGRPVGG